MEMKYIVYVTVNLCNGKLYFGVHKTNPEVFDGYIGNAIYRPQQATGQWPLHKAVRKYGYLNFRRTTIAVFPYTEEGRKSAYKLEEQIVNTTLLKSKNVYNITVGGSGGGNFTQMKTIYQYDLNGNYLRSYKCANDAAISLENGINIESTKAQICKCCRGEMYSYQNYYWSYFKDFVKKEDFCYDIKRRNNKIAQYTLSGKYLRYFENITEARVATGLVNINYAISNKASVGGYLWRYFTGDTSNISKFESTVTRYRTKPIIMIYPNGKEEEYQSIKQCVEINSELKAKGIQDMLRGRQKTHKGFKFRWKDEDIV